MNQPRLRKLKQEAQALASQLPQRRADAELKAVSGYMSAKSRNKRYVLARDFLSHWVRFIDRLKHYKTIESIAAEEKNVSKRFCKDHVYIRDQFLKGDQGRLDGLSSSE
jgi:hypothetical protein